MTQSSVSHTASSVVVCIPECKGQSGVVMEPMEKIAKKTKCWDTFPIDLIAP